MKNAPDLVSSDIMKSGSRAAVCCVEYFGFLFEFQLTEQGR